MKEFFQMLKKDPVEVKGILGQRIDTKDSKEPEESFRTLRMAFVPHMNADDYPPLGTMQETRVDAMQGMQGIEYFDEAERRGWYGS